MYSLFLISYISFSQILVSLREYSLKTYFYPLYLWILAGLLKDIILEDFFMFAQRVRIRMTHQLLSIISQVMQVSPKCLKHENQPLDFICLTSGCDNKGTVCYLCRIELHLNHDPFVSLKIFLGQFLDNIGDSREFIKEVSMIDQQLLGIRQKILTLKKKATNPDALEQAFINFWKHTSISISKFDEAVIELQNVLTKKGEELVKELNNWIRRNGDKYNCQNTDETHENLYISFLKAIYASLEMINNQLERITAKVSFQDYQILNLMTVGTATKSFKLRFSEQLKGTCMTITAPNKAAMTVQGNQRMLLLEPHLGLTKNVKKWRIKIQKLQSWIGVGVSHYDSIKSVNFDFSYTNPNHGNYLISSNGYSWNGYKMEFNSKFQTFSYTTGDIIEITYEPLNNKITFKKQGNQSVFSYDIDPNQKPIHAAINLTGIGDAVQILY